MILTLEKVRKLYRAGHCGDLSVEKLFRALSWLERLSVEVDDTTARWRGTSARK